jgi:hypothetical protein
VAQVPFKAPVHRELKGTPPIVALMNNTESLTGGNAAILESYLRLAGICDAQYDIVTPNQIRDGILLQKGYDFLWAPHWEGNTSDGNKNGKPDEQDITNNIGEFLKQGKALLGECACIMIFEKHGRFLSTKDINHNGGTMNAADIIYNDKASVYPQIGDFGFTPASGLLENWKAKTTPADYNATVTRFTIDKKGWDYYVGGYAFGDRTNGYVVYLGGHRYASCSSGSGSKIDPNQHKMKFDFEFENDISTEIFTLKVKYNGGQTSQISFTKADVGKTTGGTGSLRLDLTQAKVDEEEIQGIIFENTGAVPLTIEGITLSWIFGNKKQKLKEIIDCATDDEIFEGQAASGVEILVKNIAIPPAPGVGGVGGCADNSDCSASNIAGVRYVLNTLFNVKYQISNREYARSASIVNHPYLYQGTFEYPSWRGHFRRFDVTRSSSSAVWDTGSGKIPEALESNASASARQVFTSKSTVNNNVVTWSKVPFDSLNIATLRVPLNVTPTNNDDTDENAVISRVRGKFYDNATGAWAEATNKLGGIMHSAPAIIGTKTRTGASRGETAYVGDFFGMLHAIDTATGNEKWAYIPKNLLGKLKNNRIDPYAVQDFAAVDASPAVRDVYFDHDNDGDKEWRTILACAQGFGGRSIFALDVTDPDDWTVLWEATDTTAPGGGMGSAYGVAIDKVKWPVRDANGQVVGYEMEWIVFVATGYAQIAVNHGGINVFAFNLKTGQRVMRPDNSPWLFSAEYADSVNDIPGAVTLADTDGDSFADRVYVGDMNGRLWELNALDGTNPNGADAGKQIPLFNAGTGKPISVSPAVITHNNHTILVFGTGGADWASNAATYAVYAVDATAKSAKPTYASGAGTKLWQYDLTTPGEKVWSAPTIAADKIYVATAFGGMESSDPRQDIAAVGQPTGNLHCIDFAGGKSIQGWPMSNIGKVRGSIYVDRQHIYLATIDGQVVQIGGQDFAAGVGNRVVLRSWKQF